MKIIGFLSAFIVCMLSCSTNPAENDNYEYQIQIDNPRNLPIDSIVAYVGIAPNRTKHLFLSNTITTQIQGNGSIATASFLISRTESTPIVVSYKVYSFGVPVLEKNNTVTPGDGTLQKNEIKEPLLIAALAQYDSLSGGSDTLKRDIFDSLISQALLGADSASTKIIFDAYSATPGTNSSELINTYISAVVKSGDMNALDTIKKVVPTSTDLVDSLLEKKLEHGEITLKSTLTIQCLPTACSQNPSLAAGYVLKERDTVAIGGVVQESAFAHPHYDFYRWIDAGSSTVNIATPNSSITQVTVLKTESALTAEFKPKTYPIAVTQPLAGGQIVDQSNRVLDTIKYIYGTAEALIVAKPASGYTFTRWLTSPEVTQIAKEPGYLGVKAAGLGGTITALFNPDTISIKLGTGITGTLEVNGVRVISSGVMVQSDIKYVYGAELSVVYEPQIGYAFSRWDTSGVTLSTASATTTIKGARASATFKPLVVKANAGTFKAYYAGVYKKEYPWLRIISSIGSQETIWMAQNLNTEINNRENTCYGGVAANCETYGRLYTIYDAQTVCPEGWELPTDSAWLELEKYLGMTNESILMTTGFRNQADEYLKIKAQSTLWGQENNGTGTLGFNILPAGYCDNVNTCKDIGTKASFWTQTGSSGSIYYTRTLQAGTPGIARNLTDGGLQGLGITLYSVRCVLKKN